MSSHPLRHGAGALLMLGYLGVLVCVAAVLDPRAVFRTADNTKPSNPLTPEGEV